ncbi:hypothetical protein IC575_025662 [Cucumis melo]
MAQGYAQIEGVDFGEIFAPIARLEAIRLLLDFACVRQIMLFQMDVKCAFLNGYISEEVYVTQPKGFFGPINPDYVYKLRKALYGLKQAPRAWYDRLSTFLLNQGFSRGDTDKTMFIKKKAQKFLVAQVYVDDIIFGGQSQSIITAICKA